jgi:hypothetical protein
VDYSQAWIAGHRIFIASVFIKASSSLHRKNVEIRETTVTLLAGGKGAKISQPLIFFLEPSCPPFHEIRVRVAEVPSA